MSQFQQYYQQQQQQQQIMNRQQHHDGTGGGGGGSLIDSMPESSLLFLLDGFLSQDDNRIHKVLVSLHSYIYQKYGIPLLPPCPFVTTKGSIIQTRTLTIFPPNKSQSPSIQWITTIITTTPPVLMPNSNNFTYVKSTPNLGHLDNNSNNKNYEQHRFRHHLDICHILQSAMSVCPQLTRSRSLHDGSVPLHFAASLGYVPIANVILNNFPEATALPNDKGKIPLHYAAREGRIEMVQYFLQYAPATASMATDKRKLALHFASGDGQVNVCRLLLQMYPRGASLPSAKGKLPLHLCSRWGHIEVAKDLLRIYPDGVRALDWEGSLPIHDAAREGKTEMSRLLLELFPMSLSISNLRNEIPLFPAVRSGEIRLVALLVQAWPAGCRCILQNLSEDFDNLYSDWMSWDILELLLRGAVNKLSGCTLLDGERPPSTRLVTNDDWRSLVQPSTPPSWETGPKEKKQKKQKHEQPRIYDTTQVESDIRYITRLVPSSNTSRFTAAVNPGGATTTGGAMFVSEGDFSTEDILNSNDGNLNVAAAVVRSKSPILHDDTDPSPVSHRNYDRKRAYSDETSRQNSDLYPCKYPQFFSVAEEQRIFIPLHAALESSSSCHVIQYVLSKRYNTTDMVELDERGMLPLHWAVTLCNRENVDTAKDRDALVEMIVSVFLEPSPETTRALQIRDKVYNRLPFHFAIMSQADIRVIQAFLSSDPSQAVGKCLTHDMFYDKTPLYMATHANCSLDVVYELLRADPAFVARERQQFLPR